jgi:RNA polymerase sigma-70 factor (ECF subfamily)
MRVSADGMPRALAHHEEHWGNMTRDTTSLNGKSEAELVGDARNGNREAMAELFRRHYPHSVAVARRMLPAQDEFLDAVQSAYLSAFQKFQSFRAEASFKTWITRIVLNQCFMRLREPYRRRITLGLDDPVPRGTLPIIAVDSRTPEDLALRAEIEKAVADAVSKLPKALSDVFTRCSVSGLSIRDTAEALGLTVQATKTRLFRARSQLRHELQRAFGGGLTLATSRIGFRS